MIRRPPRSPLFPSTTLFRSVVRASRKGRHGRKGERAFAAVEVVRRLRGLLWMKCHAKRLECVQHAGAVVRGGVVRKREQAPRTPNASRSSVVALPRYVLCVPGVSFHAALNPGLRSEE